MQDLPLSMLHLLFFSDEVDIIPCFHCREEQESVKEGPIIVENHKLGMKSWCVKPLFLFAYKKLMRSHLKGRKDCNLSGNFLCICFFYLLLKGLLPIPFPARNPT